MLCTVFLKVRAAQQDWMLPSALDYWFPIFENCIFPVWLDSSRSGIAVVGVARWPEVGGNQTTHKNSHFWCALTHDGSSILVVEVVSEGSSFNSLSSMMGTVEPVKLRVVALKKQIRWAGAGWLSLRKTLSTYDDSFLQYPIAPLLTMDCMSQQHFAFSFVLAVL